MIVDDQSLYAPIVEAVMPARVDDHLRIYFSLSPYLDWKSYDQNNPTEGGYFVQVVVGNQVTNLSALDLTKWLYGITLPSEIWLPNDGDAGEDDYDYRYTNQLYTFNIYDQRDQIEQQEQGENEDSAEENTGHDGQIQGYITVGEYYRVQIRIIYLYGDWWLYDTADSGFQPEDRSEARWHNAIAHICRMSQDAMMKSDYNNANIAFSEWSTITLAKTIYRPEVYVNGAMTKNEYETEIERESQISLDVNSQLLYVYGHIDTLGKDTNDKGQSILPRTGEIESVSTCSVGLQKLINGEYITIETSEKMIPQVIQNNGSQYPFEHKFRTLLNFDRSPNYPYDPIDSYQLIVNYETRTGFKRGRKIPLLIPEEVPSLTDILFNYETDKKRGWAKLSISNVGLTDTDVIIVRSDSYSNFTMWDELFFVTVPANSSILLSDITTEYGIWYKYDLQAIYKDVRGELSIEPSELQPIIMDCDNIFIANSDGQLSLTYNGTVTQFKKNVQESSTETLGSQYPYVRRNAMVNYRSFSFNATISYNDNNETFLMAVDNSNGPNGEYNDHLAEVNINRGFKTREELFPYEAVRQMYDEYNQNENITVYNDIVLERRFREAAMDFLNSGRSFLFRSPAEGNILVRIINFSFSPKNEINNLVYDVSCECVEIAPCTVENFKKYDIQYPGAITRSVHQYTNSVIEERRGSL